MNKPMAMYESEQTWQTLPWKKFERDVYKLQKRIYTASQSGDHQTVHRLQRLLITSWGAKCIAVRKVTQDNRGRKTAGVDGIKSLTPPQRILLAKNLKVNGTAQPVRRILIPKPGKTEKRPLSIPTIRDRATQTLVKLALEPEWEAKFEPNSFGFRLGRSARDAVQAIWTSTNRLKKFVLETDIAKCFDEIDHEYLLKKLNTFPLFRRQIKAWLEAGIMQGSELFPSEAGVPQGGSISPLLANIALHGMEQHIEQKFGHSYPKINGKEVHYTPARLIRYADDLVILHARKEVIEQAKEELNHWLQPIGLRLKPEKTFIKAIDEGIDFLGYSIKAYNQGKYTSGKTTRGGTLGFKVLVQPSEESVKRHKHELKTLVQKHLGSTQAALIAEVNSLVRGWCNYYRSVNSCKCFETLSYYQFRLLYRWALRRHPKKGKYWIVRKYWNPDGNGGKWIFADKIHDTTVEIFRHEDTELVTKYVQVKGDRSPFDGDYLYWASRLGHHPMVPPIHAKLLKKQKSKCALCNLPFLELEDREIDHIIPLSQGGRRVNSNIQLAHKRCHHQKTAQER
jgi:RNA-directed DNA polymerase